MSRPSLLRVLAVAVALALPSLALINPSPAYACSCANVSISQALRNADTVFRGQIVAKGSIGRGSKARSDIRFAVDAVYKGEAYREQVVASDIGSASCGLDPEVGTTWVIFAVERVEGDGNDAVSRLVTSSCSGNLPTADAPALLGRPQGPLPGASDRAERSIRADRRVTDGLVVGGIGLVGLVALSAAGLGVMWRRRP